MMAPTPDPDESVELDVSSLSLSQIRRLVEELAEDRAEEIGRTKQPEFRQRLVETYSSYLVEHSFEPGDIVRWKEKLKNRTRPSYSTPAVVVEVLESPIVSTEESAGSAYFREQLDLLIGLLDEDDEFLILHVDSRRFEPFEE